MSASDSLATGSQRNWRGLAFRLAISAALLAVLAALLPRDQLFDALRSVPPTAWATAVPAYLLLHLLGVVKWRLMVNAAGGGISFAAAAECYYYGLFGNTFLPSVVGGDAIRVGAAIRLADSGAGVAVGSVAERLLDVAALASVAGVGVLLLPQALDGQTRQLFWSAAGIVFAVGMVGVALVVLAGKSSPRIRRVAVSVRTALGATIRQPSKVLAALCLGISLQVSLVLLNAWLGLQCGIAIPLAAWLFAWPTAKIAALVPITQGGLGVREAALAGLLLPLGIPPAMAVAAGLAFQAVIISGGLLVL